MIAAPSIARPMHLQKLTEPSQALEWVIVGRMSTCTKNVRHNGSHAKKAKISCDRKKMIS